MAAVGSPLIAWQRIFPAGILVGELVSMVESCLRTQGENTLALLVRLRVAEVRDRSVCEAHKRYEGGKPVGGFSSEWGGG